MSKTTLDFMESVKKINELKKQERLIQESFERSTGELADYIHLMMSCALEGSSYCMFSSQDCPEEYAKQLEDMGFEVVEMQGDMYIIFFKEAGDSCG